VADELPALEIFACMKWDAWESIEAGRGAEEGIIPFRDKYATGIRVKTRKNGIVVGRVAKVLDRRRD
jgi:hypothetical protein